MSLIFAIIIFAVVAGLVATAKNMLNEVPHDEGGTIVETVKWLFEDDFKEPAIVGALVAAIAYFTPRLEGVLWMSVVLFAAMIGLYARMLCVWHKKGGEWKEMIPFVALVLIFTWVTHRLAGVMSALVYSDAVARFAERIPWLLAILAIMYMVADLLIYKKVISRRIGVIAAILAGIILVAGFGFSAFAGATEPEPSTADVEESQPQFWDCHYYNDDVRADDDEDNDYNFGPNPYIEDEDVDYYVEDFANRRDEDPALLSATMLALDSVCNTDYIGETLYEGYDKKLTVLERADAATRVLAKSSNKDLFDSTNESVDEMLENAKSVKLVKEDKINDQLYMNGFTASGIPQVVIYETDVTSDWVLEYTFQIKTSEVKVCFRIPCGYQWTNPYEVLKTSTSSSGGSSSGGKGDKPTPTPTPKPTPTPTTKKDPSKDPVNQGNANVGGGKNKDTDGTGDYQATKPSKDSGSNADSSSDSGSSSSGKGSDPASGSGVTTPIEKHDDSHDSGGSSAGNNNGAFSMD